MSAYKGAIRVQLSYGRQRSSVKDHVRVYERVQGRVWSALGGEDALGDGGHGGSDGGQALPLADAKPNGPVTTQIACEGEGTLWSLGSGV